jgi:hypothetical protein
VCNATRTGKGRKLAEGDEVEYETIEAVAAVQSSVQEFAATMTSASDFNTVNALNDSLIVVIYFAIQFGVMALGIVLSTFLLSFGKSKKKDERIKNWLVDQAESQRHTHEPALEVMLNTYLESFFPAVYSNRSAMAKLLMKFAVIWLAIDDCGLFSI